MGLRPCSFTPTFASKLSNQVSELPSGLKTMSGGAGAGWAAMPPRHHIRLTPHPHRCRGGAGEMGEIGELGELRCAGGRRVAVPLLHQLRIEWAGQLPAGRLTLAAGERPREAANSTVEEAVHVL
eukprot:COSAG01_NODE_1731_length_9369_cov_35.048220_7_plen_125_part_00